MRRRWWEEEVEVEQEWTPGVLAEAPEPGEVGGGPGAGVGVRRRPRRVLGSREVHACTLENLAVL